MAGLFLLRDDRSAFAEAALTAARESYAGHGFAAPSERVANGWRVLHWPYIAGGPATFHADGEDFVAVAGSLWVDGQVGAPALAALLAIGADAPLPRARIGGQFVALVHAGGKTRLFGDYLGAFQLFHDAGARFFSTSFLAAARALPRLNFDRQGLYEFAFNVVPIGDDTVFEELKLLGAGAAVTLTPDGAQSRREARPLGHDAPAQPIEARLARHRAALMAVTQAHVTAFGDGVNCPLSGGLDSRLVLAALRAAGCRPNVYVYGPRGSEDVIIAQQIARAEGFALDWINKFEREPLAPEAFPDAVARCFAENDALPTYGNIFDSGGNAEARDKRHAGGALAVSGGCGEIFRDFFFLPDRPASAMTVAQSFFARFDPQDTSNAFDAREFLARIAAKLATALDEADPRRPLPRLRLEQLYPRIRCRSLFGREISLEARYGHYFMPFLDHHLVSEAMDLPMPLKQAGRFEAMLLTSLDPALARHMSAYGHAFDTPPGRAHRRAEWATRMRPAWLRARSYAVQRRLRPLSDEHGGLLGAGHMARVIDLSMPHLSRWFRIERVRDAGLWRRLACLEYLAQAMGDRIPR